MEQASKPHRQTALCRQFSRGGFERIDVGNLPGGHLATKPHTKCRCSRSRSGGRSSGLSPAPKAEPAIPGPKTAAHSLLQTGSCRAGWRGNAPDGGMNPCGHDSVYRRTGGPGRHDQGALGVRTDPPAAQTGTRTRHIRGTIVNRPVSIRADERHRLRLMAVPAATCRGSPGKKTSAETVFPKVTLPAIRRTVIAYLFVPLRRPSRCRSCRKSCRSDQKECQSRARQPPPIPE